MRYYFLEITNYLHRNYLLALALAVPILSHQFILDSVQSGQLLDRAAYRLPAGFSKLLGKEVEQFHNYQAELEGFLLPRRPSRRSVF